MVRRRSGGAGSLPLWITCFDESAWPGSDVHERLHAWIQAAVPYCSPSGFSIVDLFKLSRSYRRSVAEKGGTF
jgi:hypothetical protein